MSWCNEAHVELLKKLHADGLSGAEIATALIRKFPDADYSRNAVIGKLNRLGLTSSPAKAKFNLKRNSPFGAPKANPRPAAAVPKLSIAGNGAVYERAPAAPEIDHAAVSRMDRAWQPLPGSEPVTIMGLKSSSCRWPIELSAATELHYCGLFATHGSYCSKHAEVSRPRAGAKEYLDQKLGIAGRRRAA